VVNASNDPALFALGHWLSWRQAATDQVWIETQCPFGQISSTRSNAEG
jgi:hypothetical protein